MSVCCFGEADKCSRMLVFNLMNENNYNILNEHGEFRKSA